MLCSAESLCSAMSILPVVGLSVHGTTYARAYLSDGALHVLYQVTISWLYIAGHT